MRKILKLIILPPLHLIRFIIKNIIKLFEAILIGIPKITNKIVRINKFSRITYKMIIASKTRLE
jgi:hypothetical protein